MGFTDRLQDVFFRGVSDVAAAGADAIRNNQEKAAIQNNAPASSADVDKSNKMLTFGLIGIGAVVLLLVLAAFGLQWSRFNPAFIVGFRIALAASFLAVLGVFVIKPLMRRVTDEQVALYLEENEPALEAAIISAVEASKSEGHHGLAQLSDSRSPALISRLIESAIERCSATNARLHVLDMSGSAVHGYSKVSGAATDHPAAVASLGC